MFTFLLLYFFIGSIYAVLLTRYCIRDGSLVYTWKNDRPRALLVLALGFPTAMLVWPLSATWYVRAGKLKELF